MKDLFDAIVILRDNQGRFATGIPFSSILALGRSQQITIDLAALAREISSQVSAAVSTSVNAAFEQQDDRRVQVESRQLINKVVALANFEPNDKSEDPGQLSWERSEARALTGDAIDNLTRCAMRLTRAASRALSPLPFSDHGRDRLDELAARGLAISSLALSVEAVMEAVAIICYLAESATAGKIDEYGVVERELGLAVGSLYDLLRSMAGVNRSGLPWHSLVLMLHHQRVEPSMYGGNVESLSKEINLWLETIGVSEDELLRCYENTDRAYRGENAQFWSNRERFNAIAFLYWQLRYLMRWLQEHKKLRCGQLVLVPSRTPVSTGAQ